MESNITITWSIPAMLRRHTSGESSLRVDLQKPDFANAVRKLLEKFPGLSEHFDIDRSVPLNYLSIFHNEEQVTDFSDTALVLNNGDELLIVPALAGG
jgi:molybdopterin converting factor small subunit